MPHRKRRSNGAAHLLIPRGPDVKDRSVAMEKRTLASAMVAVVLFSAAQSAETVPLTTSVCELIQFPGRYDQRLVQLPAQYQQGRHFTWLVDNACPRPLIEFVRPRDTKKSMAA